MPYKDKNDQDRDGTRVCKVCNARKPMSSFYLADGGKWRFRTCKPCFVERSSRLKAAKKKADPEGQKALHRDQYLRRTYGIGQDEYVKMFQDQSGLCAICSIELNRSRHIDHDHKTGKVRGILCFTCNTALGKFHDSVDLLENAIMYLERNETK